MIAVGGQRGRSASPLQTAAAGTAVQEGIHSVRLQQCYLQPAPDQGPEGQGGRGGVAGGDFQRTILIGNCLKKV